MSRVYIFAVMVTLGMVACSGGDGPRNDVALGGGAGLPASAGAGVATGGTAGGGGSTAGVSGAASGGDATSGGSGGAGAGGAAIAAAGAGGSLHSGGSAGAMTAGSANVGGSGPNNPGCREGAFRGKTYFVCANVGTDRMTAEAFCQSRSEHLLKLDDAEEETWAFEFVTEAGSIWIGANDLDQEGDWRWADGSAVAGYTRWAVSQPNDNLGREDCVVLHSGLGEWNDVACTETVFGTSPMSFICEP